MDTNTTPATTPSEDVWKISTIRLRPEMDKAIVAIQRRRNGPGKPTTSKQVLFEEAILLLIEHDRKLCASETPNGMPAVLASDPAAPASPALPPEQASV